VSGGRFWVKNQNQQLSERQQKNQTMNDEEATEREEDEK